MKFYCCWTWHIWIVFYVEGCILFSVHLVGVNRLSACREFCGVYSWQNGTRCRDGVKLLWCHSHLVWLVFEGSIPTCACFHSENFFVTCSCCFFFGSLLGMVTEKRRGRVGRGEDAWCVQYDSTELFCSQRTKNCHKVKCF